MEEAAARARRGEIQAVVTGPIHKARMYEIGFRISGPNRILRRPLRGKEFRDAAHRRKIDRGAGHGAPAAA